MTTNKIYKTVKYFSLACLLLALASCSDEFFDVEVGERITEAEHYKDKIDARASFYGALIPLQEVAANSILVDGLRSDQMILNPNASADLVEIGNLNMRAENPLLDKSAYYKTIINANEVLAKIHIAADRDRKFLDAELKDMRATLYGLKAWCYLTVVRNYGEANYIGNDTLIRLPDDLEGNMLSKTELVETLIEDFFSDSIIYDPSESKPRTEYVYTQFPNYKAVLGELYLESGDYEKAEYYMKLGMESIPTDIIGGYEITEDVSNSNVYKVNGGYAERSWENIFVSAENKISENMCIIPYSLTEGQANPIVQYFLPTDLFMIRPAQHLVDSMELAIQSGRNPDTTDVYRGMGITYDTITAGDYFISKYSIVTSDPYSTDVILQRAGEVHLLLAEALNRNGKSDVALMLLNNGISGELSINRPAGYNYWVTNRGIRGRVGLAPRVVPDSILVEDAETPYMRALDDIEKVEMIEDFILQEKAMECAFEGKRMSDLIRIAERRDNPEEFLSSILARKYSDPTRQAMVKNFYMNRNNWYLPN